MDFGFLFHFQLAHDVAPTVSQGVMLIWREKLLVPLKLLSRF